jgi:hypothetical protein
MTDNVQKIVEAGHQLDLPMLTIFAVKAGTSRAVAHALDFDLVAVGASPEVALQKLRAAVKHHIEFGFKNGLLAKDIRIAAPKECWDKMSNANVTLGEDIEVDHQRIRTITKTVIDETEPSFTAA